MTGDGSGLLRLLPALDAAALAAAPAWLGASVVGAGAPGGADGFPLQRIAAPLLAGTLPVEAWFGRGPAAGGVAHGVRWRCDGHLLFGVIELHESAFAAGPDASPLQRASEQAYASLFRVLAETGYDCLWRVWNYIADINGTGDDGLERYREFNIGRHLAFEAAGRLACDSIPAACALGVAQGPLSVAFLAARAPARAIENPRQMSAYRYPADYGPRSPTFSRAALARLPDTDWLFISGTASIVGHQTLHAGDARAQTREAVANLAAVLDEASRAPGPGAPWRLDELTCRAYVRHPQHLPVVQAELRGALGEAAPVTYIQADVCRADLLVEVEAQACHRRGPAEV